MLAPAAWASLNFIASPYCKCCGIPLAYNPELSLGQEEGGEALTCGPCLERPPPFESARAALKYDEASRPLVLGFKHGDKTHMAATFAPLMIRAAGKMIENADMLIPVPLHRWRLLSRRYNQSAMLSAELARLADIPSYPLALRRIRATPSQGHLKAAERHANVRKAFAVHPAYLKAIAGKSVILVDDVFTSGATVGECARTLLKAGARRVDVLTIARVARDI